MSKIDRMMIQGIRSFGPEKGETIVFTTPLTLIVGWNGSGKTVCELVPFVCFLTDMCTDHH